jgi:hypothetical protein
MVRSTLMTIPDHDIEAAIERAIRRVADPLLGDPSFVGEAIRLGVYDAFVYWLENHTDEALAAIAQIRVDKDQLGELP